MLMPGVHHVGFLICVPEKEEWRTEAGITVLEGWSFQVCPDPLTRSALIVSHQFSSE